MKVLFICARFPYPPHRGDRLTAYHIIRTLARHHSVTLLSLVDGTEPAEAVETLSQWCERVEVVPLSRPRSWLQAWAGLFSPTPSQVSFYRSAHLDARLAELLNRERFESVIVQVVRMAASMVHVPHPAKILFLGDSLSLALERARPYAPWWKRPGLDWERRRLARYESLVTRFYTESWVLSPVDREDFERRGCRNIATVPHGVDERLFTIPLEPRRSKRVFFLGNLSVPHNVDAACFLAGEIWPLIRARLPDAQLEIAGADPVPAVVALARHPGVSVPGPIPDLMERWRTISVLVAPLRFSTGIQNKVLEAMAAGVPVVTTSAVASGIVATEGEAHIADSANAIADATVAVLRSPESDLERVARAREHVRKSFSWETLRLRLEQIAARGRAG